MERCDDSNGEVGEVFQYAIELWLAMAQEIRAELAENSTDRVAKIMQALTKEQLSACNIG